MLLLMLMRTSDREPNTKLNAGPANQQTEAVWSVFRRALNRRPDERTDARSVYVHRRVAAVTRKKKHWVNSNRSPTHASTRAKYFATARVTAHAPRVRPRSLAGDVEAAATGAYKLPLQESMENVADTLSWVLRELVVFICCTEARENPSACTHRWWRIGLITHRRK